MFVFIVFMILIYLFISQIARGFGISTVDYERIEVSKVDERMKDVRRGYGYEGEVLYFADQNNDIIGLLKKKTIW